MPITNDALEKIKALSTEYGKQLPSKIKAFNQLWMEARSIQSSDQYQAFLMAAHTLAGTSGTYGYKLIADAARRIEQILRNHEGYITQNEIKIIDDIMGDLNQLSVQPPEMDFQSKIDIKQLINSDVRVIHVLDADSALIAKELEPMKQFNYALKYFDNVNHFLHATYTDPPDMVVINLEFAKDISHEVVKRFREDFILIVYYSPQDDLQSRLQTVRHGGQSFLIQPFEIDALMRIFDNLFQAKMTQNEKILIVDDSEFLANYYATLLSHAGLVTETMTDAKEFLLKLSEFQPDLILMDINMPYCSGIELAQIVHQQENLSGIPIIFLSSITEKSRQLEVLSYAGDDFLTKPIDPKELLATIHNRLMRSRMLRSRMMRDSLTNLYNHTLIHHQLEREIVVAERYNRNLCVALFDIDHFKGVNDNYGHQAGDKILKDLSLYLEKNVRKSDLIGRYGGEEFLIILPNTDLNEGVKIVDDLRSGFAASRHKIGTEEIQITLSGGVANYPAIKSSSDLVKAADKALYQAKENGRNQIVAAV